MLSTGKLNRKEDRKALLSGLFFRSSFPFSPCGHALRAPTASRGGHCAGWVGCASPILLSALALTTSLRVSLRRPLRCLGLRDPLRVVTARAGSAGCPRLLAALAFTPSLRVGLQRRNWSCSSWGASDTSDHPDSLCSHVCFFCTKKSQPWNQSLETRDRQSGWSDEPDAPGLCPPSSFLATCRKLRIVAKNSTAPPSRAHPAPGLRPHRAIPPALASLRHCGGATRWLPQQQGGVAPQTSASARFFLRKKHVKFAEITC